MPKPMTPGQQTLASKIIAAGLATFEEIADKIERRETLEPYKAALGLQYKRDYGTKGKRICKTKPT